MIIYHKLIIINYLIKSKLRPGDPGVELVQFVPKVSYERLIILWSHYYISRYEENISLDSIAENIADLNLSQVQKLSLPTPFTEIFTLPYNSRHLPTS